MINLPNLLLGMKFLADVNIAQSVIRYLRHLGHDVLDVKLAHSLDKDVELILLAQYEKLIILTRDKDFIELVKIPKYQVPVIAIQPINQKPANIIKHLDELLRNQGEEVLEASLTIIIEELADSTPY